MEYSNTFVEVIGFGCDCIDHVYQTTVIIKQQGNKYIYSRRNRQLGLMRHGEPEAWSSSSDEKVDIKNKEIGLEIIKTIEDLVAIYELPTNLDTLTNNKLKIYTIDEIPTKDSGICEVHCIVHNNFVFREFKAFTKLDIKDYEVITVDDMEKILTMYNIKHDDTVKYKYDLDFWFPDGIEYDECGNKITKLSEEKLEFYWNHYERSEDPVRVDVGFCCTN